MSEILYLNKIKIELLEGQVTRKLQIGDIGEISDRKSTFSYTFKIPRTAKNEIVLDMLGSLGNTSRKPFEKIIADYVVDGIFLIADGIAIIKATAENFEINLIDGVRGLVDLLSGKKLSDLPLDDLNHVLTTQAYIDSYENTEGYIYGIANYGLGVVSILKVEKQAPSIFTHTLFRRIFDAAGLTLQGEFFTTNNNYLNEVVTPSVGYTVSDVAYSITAKGGATSDTISDYQEPNEYTTFNEKFTLSDDGLVGASIVSGNMVFSVAGTYKLDLNTFYDAQTTSLNLEFKINGISRASFFFPGGVGQIKENTVTFTVEIGDIVQLWTNGSTNLIQGAGGTSYILDYSIQTIPSLFLQTGSQLIAATDYIGEMNQIDFVKDVINRYGLVMNPIIGTNNYEFKRFEALLNDTENAEDWSEKLSVIIDEDYNSGYAKKNKATYKYPDAIVIPNNDGEMIIENENTEEEKQMFSSAFEIPQEDILLGGNQTYLVEIWEDDGGTVNKETPLKVMHISRYDISITAKLFTEVTGITVTEDIPFLTLENMSMEFFLTSFYNSFQSLINNYKNIEAKFNLSVVDIHNINFLRLKYLRQTQRYYYLSTVLNKTGSLSRVNMVEIQEFPENQPPSQIGDYEFEMDFDFTATVTLEHLKTGYEDPELDEPKKIKIIDGFNADLIMKNDGVTISSETEINVEDLDLTLFDSKGGPTPYTKEYTFNIADVGSGDYSEDTGKIIANVLEDPA